MCAVTGRHFWKVDNTWTPVTRSKVQIQPESWNTKQNTRKTNLSFWKIIKIFLFP